jgi:hypothetical protein
LPYDSIIIKKAPDKAIFRKGWVAMTDTFSEDSNLEKPPKIK